LKLDYTLLVYPLHVLATNRTCDTIVSRQKLPGFRAITDLSNIRSLSGLFIGFIPYTFSYVASSFETKSYKEVEGLYTKQRNKGWFSWYMGENSFLK